MEIGLAALVDNQMLKINKEQNQRLFNNRNLHIVMTEKEKQFIRSRVFVAQSQSQTVL